MGFELLKKQIVGSTGMPYQTIAVSKSSIGLSADLGRYFAGHKFVEVYLNRDELQVGLIPSNNKDKGYRVYFTENKHSTKVNLAVRFIMRNVARGIYPITLQGNMLVFPVMEIPAQ